MTPEEVTAFIQSLGQKGVPQAADFNILQNAILGVLTGTYRPSYIAKTSTELVDEYMPNLAAAADSNDPILRKIGQLVANGTSAWETKQEVKRLLANNAMSGIAVDSPLNSEYLSQVDLYDREWRAYNNANAKNERDRIANDPFLSAGLPAFEERYNPEAFAPELFDKFSKDLAARRATTKVYQPQKFPPGQKPSTTATRKYEPKIPIVNAPKEYKNIAQTNVGTRGNELMEAQMAFDKFVKKNPDTYDLEYQTLLDALNNAERRYSEGVVDAVGLTGASNTKGFATSDMLKTIATDQTNKETKTPKRKGPYARGSVTPLSTKPFDVEKAGLAAGTSKAYEDRVRAELRRLVAARLEAEGRTPLMDQLTARGLFIAASAQPKTSKKNKSYRVKGSEVVQDK